MNREFDSRSWILHHLATTLRQLLPSYEYGARIKNTASLRSHMNKQRFALIIELKKDWNDTSKARNKANFWWRFQFPRSKCLRGQALGLENEKKSFTTDWIIFNDTFVQQNKLTQIYFRSFTLTIYRLLKTGFLRRNLRDNIWTWNSPWHRLLFFLPKTSRNNLYFFLSPSCFKHMDLTKSFTCLKTLLPLLLKKTTWSIFVFIVKQ